MRYIDVLAGAFSHHTGLSEEKIRNYLWSRCKTDSSEAILLRSVLRSDLPEHTAIKLMNRLIKSDLEVTSLFLIKTLKEIRQETQRQSVLN
jgi:hypothetical protein